MNTWVTVFLLACPLVLLASVQKTVYHYDNWSRLIEFQLPANVSATYTYDIYNRVTSLSNHVGDAKRGIIAKFTYAYNRAWQITNRGRLDEFGDKANEDYKYDVNNRLEDYTCSGILCPKDTQAKRIYKQYYTFDAFNNITSVASNNNTVTYYYDPNYPTRLVRYRNSNSSYKDSWPFVYDKSGNTILDDIGSTISYNPLNRVSSVITMDEGKTMYVYNGAGVQVAQINHNQKPFYLIYGKKHLLNSIENGKITSYIYGDKGIGSQTDTAYEYYLSDKNNTVVNKVSHPFVGHDQLYTYNYDSYGNQVNDVPDYDAAIQHFSFDGQLSDRHTNWQFLGRGYRAYNPVLHRFMSDDSMSPFGRGGINGYVFGNNNPIAYTDPTGHMTFWENIGLGLAFGMVGSVLTSEMGGWGAFLVNALFGVVGANLDTIHAAIHHKHINWKVVAEKSAVSGLLNGIGGILPDSEIVYTGANNIVSSTDETVATDTIEQSFSQSRSSFEIPTTSQQPNLFICTRYNPLFDDDDYGDVPLMPNYTDDGTVRLRNIYFGDQFTNSFNAEHLELNDLNSFGFDSTSSHQSVPVRQSIASRIRKIFSRTSKDDQFDLQMEDFGSIDDFEQDSDWF